MFGVLGLAKFASLSFHCSNTFSNISCWNSESCIEAPESLLKDALEKKKAREDIATARAIKNRVKKKACSASTRGRFPKFFLANFNCSIDSFIYLLYILKKREKSAPPSFFTT